MSTTMTLNQDHNGMKADRRAEAEQTYTHVILCLRDHPCVSFALSYCGRVHWSPELDVAVRLMLLVTDGGLVPSDQMVATTLASHLLSVTVVAFIGLRNWMWLSG